MNCITAHKGLACNLFNALLLCLLFLFTAVAQASSATQSKPLAQSLSPQDSAQILVQKGLSHYHNRAQKSTKTIDSALYYYQQAIRLLEPQDTKAFTQTAIHYLNALCFKGNHLAIQSKAKKQVFELGKKTTEAWIHKYPNQAGFHYWHAVFLSLWAQEVGILTAARTGTAQKIKTHCEKAIALNPHFSKGAAYQVLGILYHAVPKLPFLTPWANSEIGEQYVRKSIQMNPKDLTGLYLLAKILHDNKRTEEANNWIQKILVTPPRNEWLLEDLRTKKQTRELSVKP